MSSNDVFDVQKIARLARLRLDDKEAEALSKELAAILSHARDLDALKLDDVMPTAHAVSLTCPSAADEVRPSMPAERSLANAPDKDGTAFKVPKVIE